MATMRAALAMVATVTMLMLVVPSAHADEIAHCWYERDGGALGQGSHLVCRIAGSDTVIDYVVIDPPPPLWPAVGRDAAGECWYNRTIFTGWRIVRQDGDNNAYMQYSTNDTSAGPWIDVDWIRRCINEPTEVETVIELLWEEIANFDFETPDAELQPGTGVTGLPTYVDVDPPRPDTRTLVSPVTGEVVEAEFVVAAVTIDWGDGSLDEITPSLYPLFGPYPDGRITHMYETKGTYDATVSYVWSVRWRYAGDAWQVINDIDPTTWTTPYQVDEIVTRVTG